MMNICGYNFKVKFLSNWLLKLWEIFLKKTDLQSVHEAHVRNLRNALYVPNKLNESAFLCRLIKKTFQSTGLVLEVHLVSSCWTAVVHRVARQPWCYKNFFI